MEASSDSPETEGTLSISPPCSSGMPLQLYQHIQGGSVAASIGSSAPSSAYSTVMPCAGLIQAPIDRRKPNRTGWPEAVWAKELNN